MILVRISLRINCCSDIAALARAAVSGDESALDMFNWKQKGKSNLKLSNMLGHNEAMTFYIGTQNGCQPSSIARLSRTNSLII